MKFPPPKTIEIFKLFSYSFFILVARSLRISKSKPCSLDPAKDSPESLA